MSEVSNRRFVHFDGTKDEFIIGGYPETYKNSIVFINGDGDDDKNTIYTHGEYYGEGVIVKGDASNSAVLKNAQNSAKGEYGVAIGYKCVAEGKYSHVEGELCHTEGCSSHAEGYRTRTYGCYSHAEGNCCEAHGNFSHAEGYRTRTYRGYSHAEGHCCEAHGAFSHAEGTYTKTTNESEFACGKYNNSDASTLFSVGVGSSNERKNAMEVTSDGQVFFNINSVLTQMSLPDESEIENILNMFVADLPDSDYTSSTGSYINYGTTSTGSYINYGTTSVSDVVMTVVKNYDDIEYEN